MRAFFRVCVYMYGEFKNIIYQTICWGVVLTDTGVHIRHCDEVEDEDVYKDTDLGEMEEHKNIILHLLSQLKLGMDLTKVVYVHVFFTLLTVIG